jgi:hypothetical protein
MKEKNIQLEQQSKDQSPATKPHLSFTTQPIMSDRAESHQRNISNDAALENMHNTPEEISNQARGHKANLSNPSKDQSLTVPKDQITNILVETSEESKQNSKKALEELGGEKAFFSKQGTGDN